MTRILIVNALVAIVLISILDLGMYFFVPVDYVWRFPAYRNNLAPDVAGRGAYSTGYFVSQERRGFDIGENVKGRHWVSGVSYPIWSNSLGCFDLEYSSFGRYAYFAGDSFTWGYTPFEKKFGSLIEQKTGTQILKCGVTHTGQIHQLEKLKEVVEKIGVVPEAVFVFYFYNDVMNDYAHPHSTVLEGWLVDNVSLDRDDLIVRHSRQEMIDRVHKKLKMIESVEERRLELRPRIREKLKHYSFAFNLISYVRGQIFSVIRQSTSTVPLKVAAGSDKQLEHFYTLPHERNGRFWYTENSKARNNKAALREFANYSKHLNAEFTLVLIPPRRRATDSMWYVELREFLDDNGIKYLDLASEFKKMQVQPEDLYWRADGHFSPLGNEIVADILLEKYGKFLGSH